MSFVRHEEGIVFECDSCDKTLETGTGDFGLALVVAKTENWEGRLGGTPRVWFDYCSEKCLRRKDDNDATA